MPGDGVSTAAEAMLMMEPPPRSTITLPAAWHPYSTPLRFTVRMRSNSSGSRSMMELSIMMPAMLHMTSSRPCRSAMWPISIAAAPRWATSSSALSAKPFSLTMPRAVSAARAASMSAQTTVAPAAASTSAVVRPMPPPAPVTSATRPVRSNAFRTVPAFSTRAP